MGWYQNQLKHPKWQKKRLEILERDQFKCTLCQDDETELHIHHKQYDGKPWEVDSKYLTTLCKKCHHVVEIASKSFPNEELIECKTFGNNILKAYNSQDWIFIYSFNENDDYYPRFHIMLLRGSKVFEDLYEFSKKH